MFIGVIKKDSNKIKERKKIKKLKEIRNGFKKKKMLNE